MENKFDKIKTSLVELILNSTCHGLPSFFRTPRVLFKMMWIVLFLTSSGFCSYLIANIIMEYLSYKFVTSIDIIQENPTQFPTVTFCNLKRKNSTYNLNETIIYCRFGEKNCSASDFRWHTDIRSGYCFVFNSLVSNRTESLKNSTIAGFYNGLYLNLYTGPLNEFDNGPESNGFHIYVNNYSIPIDPNIGADVSTGVNTRLSVFRKFMHKLGRPYNDCQINLDSVDTYDSEIYKEMHNFSIPYAQNYCFGLLALKQVSIKCNCSGPLNKLELLCSLKDSICLRTIYSKFFIENNYEKLAKQCPLECDSISYKLISSVSDLDYIMLNKYLNEKDLIKSKYRNQSITYDILKKTTLVVAVYYEDLSYTMVTQSPKIDLLSLVSNIGGLLGLFIGTSFLSFAEIIEIMLEVVFICFETRSINNEKPNIF